MADYDGAYGYPDNYQSVNISATATYPKTTDHISGSKTYHGVDIDTATIVSIASSCIILISGCIAVVCLIMYMKKTDMLYRSRTCAKCGAHVNRDEVASTRVPNRNESAPALEGTPEANRIYHPAMIEAHQNAKNLGSLAIFRGFSAELSNNTNEPKRNFSFGNDDENNSNSEAIHNAIGKSCKTPVEFMKTSFMDKSDEYFDENEPTPYATFNLAGLEKDSKLNDSYETFTAKFTEPPYMLLKKGLDCTAPPQYADSVDYKLRLIENVSGKLNEDNQIYQATGLSQCHSIASCSSNHEELLRAYEYGKQHKQKLLKLQDEFIEALNENDTDETCYRSLASERESPTDPGIREFTKSPPKPNEKRQGIVFHHQPTAAEMIEISKQIIGSNPKQNEFAIQQVGQSRESQPDKNDLSPNETSNSFSSIQGSSSSEAHSSTSSNDSTPSAGSESGNGEVSSSSTATPEQLSGDDKQTTNFGAIPRDRSRNPSWASFTTMKSNTVLTPQYPDSQLATERAFMSKSNSTIKEGLSSDEDDFVHKQAAPEFDSKCVPTRAAKDLFEDIYGSRLAAYGNFGAGQLVPTSKEKGAELFGKRSSNLDATLYTSGSGNNRSGCSHQQPPVSGSQLDKSSALFLGTSTPSQEKTASSLKRITSEIDC